MDWMLLAWRKYIDFSGRARRKEYWMYILGLVIAGIVATIGDWILFGGLLSGLLGVAAIIPTIACQVRRFQDQDRPGLLVLLNLVPVIGNLAVLVFMCMEGTRGPNQYGHDPKSGSMATA